MKIRFLLLLLVSVGSFPTMGQFIQSKRFEEEIPFEEKGYAIISLKKEGLALIREKANETDHKKKNWQIETIDTTLVKAWSMDILLGREYDLVGYEYNPGHIYLLYREGDKYFHSFLLVTIDTQEKNWKSHDIKFEVDFNLSHFTMAGESAVFGGQVINEPAVLIYDPESSKPKVLPGLFVKQMKLLDVRSNQNESFNVLIERIDNDKTNLLIRTFDKSGNLIFDDVLAVDQRYNIQTGMTSSLEREEMIVFGTYSISKNQNSVGFYSAVIDPFGDQNLIYTDFGSMTSFLDYMPAKKAQKIKDKARELKEAGQLPSFSSSVVPIRIDERKDGFYALAEVYHSSQVSSPYPYSSSNYYNPMGYGYYPYGINPYNRFYNSPYNYTPYSGSRNIVHTDVQMVESVVVKLNPYGMVEKDASIKLNNIRHDALEQTGDFIVNKDSIFLLYKKNNEIFYQNEVRDTLKTAEKVLIQSDHDYLKSDNQKDGTIRHWFDNSFYVWGYQNVKDIKGAFSKTRRLFYVNKISRQ